MKVKCRASVRRLGLGAKYSRFGYTITNKVKLSRGVTTNLDHLHHPTLGLSIYRNVPRNGIIYI